MSVIESSTSPAGLIDYIIGHCTHPTTVVIGCTSTQFVQQWHDDDDDGDDDDEDRHANKTTLLEVAVARHIRVVFVPTVAHLRGWLAAFDTASSPIAAPPSRKDEKRRKEKGKLIVYNLLRIHRDTSEWSAQGLGTTAAVLEEAGYRTGMGVMVVGERPRQEEGQGGERDGSLWDERVPVASTSARRQLEKAGYPTRTEQIRTVLGRWFIFKELGEGEEEEVDEEDMEDEREKEEEEKGNEEKREEERGEEEKEEKKEEESIEAVEAVQAPPAQTSPPRRTFVKDSEDEDDDFSDDETELD